jgi:hypothetical protein
MSGWVNPLLEDNFRALGLLHSGANDWTHLRPHVNASPAVDAGT